MGGSSQRDKEKSKAKDLSDVARRVGGGSSAARGFDIYVDSTDDPELDEIVMVKKQKSRGGLDGMAWGALGEVTNVPQATQSYGAPAPIKPLEQHSTLAKIKAEEKEKWWSIGRGRKDSKEKNKEKENSKTSKASRAKSQYFVSISVLSQPALTISHQLPNLPSLKTLTLGPRVRDLVCMSISPNRLTESPSSGTVQSEP